MIPLISIITPVYNAESYIKQSIDSVLLQTYPNWELILIDDCSTDNSINIIYPYLSDPRIKLFQNNVNQGPALSRNRGLDNAKGDYITFLDADDFWLSERLESQLRFMQEHHLLMGHGDYYFCDLNGEIIKPIKVDRKIDYSCLLKGNQFKTMTMMLSRRLISTYRFENIKHEDYAFFLECLKRTNYSLAQDNIIHSYCRIGNQKSISSNKLKSAVWTFNIYRKHQSLSLLRTMYCFIHYAFHGLTKYKK